MSGPVSPPLAVSPVPVLVPNRSPVLSAVSPPAVTSELVSASDSGVDNSLRRVLPSRHLYASAASDMCLNHLEKKVGL